MVIAPGYLDDLDQAGLQAWEAYLARTVRSATDEGRSQWGRSPAILADGDPSLGGVAPIDWPAAPIRILGYLSNFENADVAHFLDWQRPSGQIGRVIAHEEYLEWRVVRDADDVIQQVELTCETPDYMGHVAGWNPERLLSLAAEFAGEQTADAQDIFGAPDYRRLTPEQRRQAFQDRHESINGASPISNYGNGVKAMICMCQRVNRFAAAVNLAVRAAFPFGVNGRPLTGPEAIVGEAWAAACRNSDPHIATSIIRAVHAGKKIALVDPAAIYMKSYPREEVTLDGQPLPEDWLNYSRGAPKAKSPLKRDLFQRLVVRPPKNSGKTFADLRDSNGEVIRSGLQIARHQSVSIFYRTTPPSDVTSIEFDPAPVPEPCGPDSAQSAYYQKLMKYFIQETQEGDVIAAANTRTFSPDIFA
jgi:hypothetical protein